MVAVSNLLQKGFILANQDIYMGLATPEQASVEQYNVVKFLGGQAPYIQNPGFGISTDVPDGCSLEQIQLISRHGERYPTSNVYGDLTSVNEKFKSYNGTLKGDLSFLNDYTFFIPNEDNLGLETNASNSYGPFAGTSNALRHGTSFRTRYSSLFNSNDTLKVFTSNSNRVYYTSQYFARGFLGENYSEDAVDFIVLNEDSDMGANSLTPREACTIYKKDQESDYVDGYSDAYLSNAAQRFMDANPGLNITNDDVTAMFEWCAYEINVMGSSPMCGVFTNEEFIKYSYSLDLSNYYSHGPGNNSTRIVASQMVNASLALLQEENPSSNIWLSFTHDTDLEIYLSSLGIFEREGLKDLPNSYIPFPHLYVHSSIVPQGARLYTEKLQCSNESYVRLILNDAVYPIPELSNGPGFSTKLSDYADYINNRIGDVDFNKDCNATGPDMLSFYWDYPTKNYTAPLII